MHGTHGMQVLCDSELSVTRTATNNLAVLRTRTDTPALNSASPDATCRKSTRGISSAAGHH